MGGTMSVVAAAPAAAEPVVDEEPEEESDVEEEPAEESEPENLTPLGYPMFEDLSEEEQNAAITMGHTEETWNIDEQTPYADLSWEELSDEQKEAVKILGENMSEAEKWLGAIGENA